MCVCVGCLDALCLLICGFLFGLSLLTSTGQGSTLTYRRYCLKKFFALFYLFILFYLVAGNIGGQHLILEETNAGLRFVFGEIFY